MGYSLFWFQYPPLPGGAFVQRLQRLLSPQFVEMNCCPCLLSPGRLGLTERVQLAFLYGQDLVIIEQLIAECCC